ncbi:MAG: hypothetical protein ACOCXQ_04875, partial [Patescibacteria group bacterium]
IYTTNITRVVHFHVELRVQRVVLNDDSYNTETLEQIIDDFLMVDDSFILTQIKVWSKETTDETLKSLALEFINRTPLKLIKEVENGQLYSHAEFKKIDGYFKSINENTDDNFRYDEPVDNPYKDDYLLGKKSGEDAELIWLLKEGKTVELSTDSMLIKALENKQIKKYRAYVRKKHYTELLSLLS